MNNQTNEQLENNEIGIKEIIYVIKTEKIKIIFISFLCFLMSFLYAINLSNVYQSEAVIAPVSENDGLQISNKLGGLAALAGVDIGKTANKTTQTIEVIKSRRFLGNFIIENDLVVTIYATIGWNKKDNQLIVDENLYDVKNNAWIQRNDGKETKKPSMLETIGKFKNLISITEDKNTGLVKISVEHYSPYVAKDIAEKLIKTINSFQRKKDLEEAEISLVYLNDKLSETSNMEVKKMLYSLIEEQTKKIMLANVKEEYAFKTIDPAVVPEKKYKPMRAIICVIGLIIGIILGVVYAFISTLKSKQSIKE